MMVKIEIQGQDALTMVSYQFWVNYPHVIINRYEELSRATTRHKFMVDRSFIAGLNYVNANRKIKLEDVPITPEIEELVKKEILANLQINQNI